MKKDTRVLLTLFLLSGFVGVMAEQVFERLLSVVVGGTTPAAAVVLSVFFTGLGLGGYVAARALKRGKLNPLRAYGLAELAIAACCALVLLLFDTGRGLFAPLLVWGAGDPWSMLAVRVIVAAVVVLPSAFAMGLSFPFLSALASRRTANSGLFIARLYTVNLFGAAAAAVLAPYLVLPWIGLSGALLLCLTIDSGVAYYAIRLAKLEIEVAAPESPQPKQVVATVKTAHYPILGVAFLSGFVFFALEIAWTHIVAVVINSSVYAFSSMLFFVTLGLGLGSRAAANTLRRGKETINISALFMLCAGLLIVQTALWPAVPGSMAEMGHQIQNFYLGQLLRWLHLALLLLPMTFLYGMIYPALFSDERFQGTDGGSLVGYMGAVNSLGCVLGALVASFYLIPAIGSEMSLRVLAVALSVCGLLMAVVNGKARTVRFAAAAAAGLILMIWVSPHWDPLRYTSGLNVHFKFNAVNEETKLLYFHEDSYGGVTTVVENMGEDGRPERVLLTNGKFQGNDQQQVEAQVAFTAIPALHLTQTRDALVIGFGTGQSAALLNDMGFSSVDVAEIAPGILDAADKQFRHINKGILSSERTTVFLEDGRNVLLTRPKKYDLISIEVSSVWFSGSTNIYSKEFYDLARNRLSETGVFQQWIQLHHIGTKEVECIIGTVREAFPYVSLWYFGGQGVIVASAQQHSIQPEGRAAVMNGLLEHFSGNETQVEDMMARIARARVIDSDATDRIRATGPIINNDWNRWLEYWTPRYNLSDDPWQRINLTHLLSFNRPAEARR